MFPVPEEFQSLSLMFPSLLCNTLYLQGAVHFLQPIFLPKFWKYSCVVWLTLFLLAFYIQARGCALFLYAPHITCICHIPLISLPFSMLLCSAFAPVMQILMMFSWSQYCISTSQILLHYIVQAYTILYKLPNLVAYSFFVHQLRSFSVFYGASFHSV